MVAASSPATPSKLAAVVAFAVSQNRRSPSPVPVADAAVLEAAATAAEQQPFVAPRDDQWIYTQDKFSERVPRFRQEKWRRADGGGLASYDENGKLQVEMLHPRRGRTKPVPLGPLAEYQQLAALPTDPDTLLKWAYDRRRTSKAAARPSTRRSTGSSRA